VRDNAQLLAMNMSQNTEESDTIFRDKKGGTPLQY